MDEEELICPIPDIWAAIKTFLYYGKEVRAERNRLAKELPGENKFTVIINALYEATNKKYAP